MGESETDRPRHRGAPPPGRARESHSAAAPAVNDDLVSRIVDSSVDGIIAFDRDCRYTLWNAPMERLTGVSRQRAVGAVAFDLFPFLKDIGEEEHFYHALAGRTSVSTDRFFRIVETGREGWFEGYYSPLYGPGAQDVIGGVAIIRDVTERKRAEADQRAAAEQRALRDSEERYRAFIRNSSEGIWRFELETPVRTDAPEDEQVDAFYASAYLAECNDAMARMYGYGSCDEISGARLADMLPRADAHNVEYLRHFIRSGYRLTDAESHEVDRAGNPKTFVNNLVGVVENGMLLRAWGTQRDVTEQKKGEATLQRTLASLRQAHASLRLSETRFRKLVEQSPLSKQIFSPDGRVLTANRAWERLFGVTLADIPDYNILQDEQLVARGVMPLIRRGFEGGAAVIPPIPYVPDRGAYKGQQRWCGAVIYGVKDDDGRVEQVILVHEDLTERKSAEETLRRSEERYERATRAGKVGVWELDLATDALYLAPHLKSMLGYSAEELPDRRDAWFALVHPDDKPRIVEARRAHLAGQTPSFEVEVRRWHKDGTYRWFMSQGAALRDASGRPYKMVGSDTDITDRKRVEEALREAADRLGLALAASKMGDWSWDPATDLTTMSPRAAEIFGIPPGPAMTWADIRGLLHADDQERAHLAVERAVAERGDYDVEYRVNRPSDGRQVWVAAKGRGQYDAAGRVLGMQGVVQDVTERKHAEQALKEAYASLSESEERLRLGLEAGNTGTWDWDMAAGQVTWSERVYEFHGLRPGEFGGTVEEFTRLIHPDDRDRVAAEIQAAIERRVPYETEFRVVHPHTGEVRWLMTNGRVFFDAAGRPVRMLGATSDVTGRKRAEAERDQLLDSERAARGEAERASRLKDEFLATVSHELRTPLNAILGYAQLLRTGRLEEGELAEGLEVIERNARAQAQIIEDILDMSRIVSGKLRLDVQRVDLPAVVEAALETVRPAAEAKGIVVHTDLDPAAGPVGGDPGRLQQVAWNLLSNAIKFTARGGSVRVSLAPTGSGHVELGVSDDGQGIRPEFLPFVFDKFRQGDASAARKHSGLGLGLAIVKSLVELHGGTVRALSAGEGLGSTFVVTLPVSVFYSQPQAAAGVGPGTGDVAFRDRRPRGDVPFRHPAECPSLEGVRALIVDDEPDALSLARRLLEECGSRVTTAASAAEALAALDRGGADVIVSDIGMPGVDGYEFIRRVRARGPSKGGDTPAAALTAFARTEDRTRALMAGYQTHVAKPVEPAELIAAVASLVGRTGKA